MRSRGGVLPIAVIGLIVLMFTLAAFFLLEIGGSALNIWALGFLLLSEVILFGGLIGLRLNKTGHSEVFMKSGVTTALALYFAATLIGVLLSGFFGDNLGAFVLMELGVLALFAIITISILAF